MLVLQRDTRTSNTNTTLPGDIILPGDTTIPEDIILPGDTTIPGDATIPTDKTIPGIKEYLEK